MYKFAGYNHGDKYIMPEPHKLFEYVDLGVYYNILK